MYVQLHTAHVSLLANKKKKKKLFGKTHILSVSKLLRSLSACSFENNNLDKPRFMLLMGVGSVGGMAFYLLVEKEVFFLFFLSTSGLLLNYNPLPIVPHRFVEEAL